MPHHPSPYRRALNASTLPRTALALVLAVVVALVGGCAGSSDDDAPALSTTEHNDTDVAFAGDMLQHHAQALAMVDLTLGRPLDPQVERLGEQIRDAQAPEIETFADWLTEWGEEVPATVRDHASAHRDDGADDPGEAAAEEEPAMAGMMSAGDMQALEDAPDGEFQTMWLEMMVEHHQGALEMAQAEIDGGQYEPAVDLAGDIVDSQTAEIERMQDLLGS